MDDKASTKLRDGRQETAVKTDKHTRAFRFDKKLKIVISIVGVALAILLAYVGYVYATTPAAIRQPKLEHYHFRMQILVDGKAEDFSSKNYQTGYSKDQCNSTLPDQPIHFHDGQDQFVHIHWEGITGGLVMKYYGWNYIGGPNGSLGYRLDKPLEPRKVAIHGDYLPMLPANARFYVYTGDGAGYKERSFDDWKSQDLEKFFGRKSTFPAHDLNYGKKSGFIDQLFPKVYAHGAMASNATMPEQEELTRINNFEGNVVIFAQKTKPTDQQVKDRFATLIPLSNSTCGG